MDPGVGIAPSPPPTQLTAHQKIPTPSRAEHGPGGRFAFTEGAQVYISAQSLTFPVVMRGDGSFIVRA